MIRKFKYMIIYIIFIKIPLLNTSFNNITNIGQNLKLQILVQFIILNYIWLVQGHLFLSLCIVIKLNTSLLWRLTCSIYRNLESYQLNKNKEYFYFYLTSCGLFLISIHAKIVENITVVTMSQLSWWTHGDYP